VIVFYAETKKTMPSTCVGTEFAHIRVNTCMAEKQALTISKSFNNFLHEMTRQYNVSRDELMRAYDAFGEFRGKIWAHCIVQSWLKKKGLPTNDAKLSVVNRWFPS
jgi:hypothetical protein